MDDGPRTHDGQLKRIEIHSREDCFLTLSLSIFKCIHRSHRMQDTEPKRPGRNPAEFSAVFHTHSSQNLRISSRFCIRLLVPNTRALVDILSSICQNIAYRDTRYRLTGSTSLLLRNVSLYELCQERK